MNNKYSELVKKYPELFEKASTTYFEVDKGWYDILDVFCRLVSWPVNMAKRQVECYVDDAENLQVAKDKLQQEIDKLPIIAQVKEKFGTLRIYVSNSNQQVDSYIEFAENMSARICEKCGLPGQPRNTGWIKTLCDDHYKERIESQRGLK